MPGLDGSPSPVVIEESDILDMAVGESHAVALTTENQVYVIGSNGNGQLGLEVKSAETWTNVNLDLSEKQKAVGVAAGPRCSFITVQTGLD